MTRSIQIRGALRWQLLCASYLILAVAPFAPAQVLISNFPSTDGTSTFMNAPSGGSNGGGVHDSKAAGFTIPAGTDYNLTSIDLRLNFFTLDSVPVVAIYDNNASNNPGTMLTTLVNPTFAVGFGTYTFTPSSAFTLSNNTTYWMVLHNAAAVANSFQWMASLPSVTPTGIATTAGYRFSNGPPPPTGNSTTFNTYSVSGTVVPEPTSLVLVGIGAAGWIARVRSRRSLAA
jgi:hypothetical protein